MVLFTVLLLLANGPGSPLLLGYLLLTGGAALRFRQALVWFVNGLSAAGYLDVHHVDRFSPTDVPTITRVIDGLRSLS